MQTIKAGEGQTVLDIAMRYCGNAETAKEISELNNISITEDLIPGQSIVVPDAAIENKKTVAEFETKDLQPASRDEFEGKLEGIGFWIINKDFVVS